METAECRQWDFPPYRTTARQFKGRWYKKKEKSILIDGSVCFWPRKVEVLKWCKHMCSLAVNYFSSTKCPDIHFRKITTTGDLFKNPNPTHVWANSQCWYWLNKFDAFLPSSMDRIINECSSVTETNHGIALCLATYIKIYSQHIILKLML